MLQNVAAVNFVHFLVVLVNDLALQLPYFSLDNAHLMYNAHPKLFRHCF